MDDVTIHIDELSLDGSAVVEHAAIAAALREQFSSALPPVRADAASRAVATALLESLRERRR
jgi:hypothetical protein